MKTSVLISRIHVKTDLVARSLTSGLLRQDRCRRKKHPQKFPGLASLVYTAGNNSHSLRVQRCTHPGTQRQCIRNQF